MNSTCSGSLTHSPTNSRMVAYLEEPPVKDGCCPPTTPAGLVQDAHLIGGKARRLRLVVVDL